MGKEKAKQNKKTDNVKNELLRYVKSAKTGKIYEALPAKKNNAYCYLRRKNLYVKHLINDVRQGVANGTWKAINEHELKKWKKEDEEFKLELTSKLVKRSIIAQLLIESDEELKKDFEDDKRFRAVLNRSIKETERIALKHYDTIYGANNTLVSNIMNATDRATSKISKFNPHDFLQLNTWLDKYIENPKEAGFEEIEMEKLNSN